MPDYDATWESLDSHEIPAWFRDAKLGIFIHWGVYSVPAWAPPDAELGSENASPYAEWYPYYMYEARSPTRNYHVKTHGEDVEYADFIEDFTAENWDPEEWADLFADIGAGYVVLTGEHHDGFPLWDSHYTKYNAAEMGPERDIVDELGTAVRDRDLRFAASYHANCNYYQPGFEGRFGHPDYSAGFDTEAEAGPGPEYVAFMNAKHRELIRTYDPDMLWFDMPQGDSHELGAKELIADFYNRAADRGHEVVVNDRASKDAQGPALDLEGWDNMYHGDFFTPEYVQLDAISDEYYEANRGIGRSFGYNRAANEEDYLTREEVVHSLVDIVSKNGNLLLNIGPRADGTIPEIQRDRLEALGSWLSVNGTAIFGTRPWVVADDATSEVAVRYTHRDGDLYAIALGWTGEALTLSVPEHVDLDESPDVSLLTDDGESDIDTHLTANRLTMQLPNRPSHDYAYTFRIPSVENPRASKFAN